MTTANESRASHAAAIAFCLQGGVLQVLTIRGNGTPDGNSFPRRRGEAGEALHDCAMRALSEGAGVRGTLVGAVDRLATYKDEIVRHVVMCVTEPVPAPAQSAQWLPLALATEALDGESRRALQEAMPIIDGKLAAGGQGDATFREFLKKEYEHMAESFLKSEEDGDRRVQFFLATVVGACAVLAFYWQSVDKTAQRPSEPFYAAALILAMLLVLGQCVCLRLIKRNENSDKFKDNMRRIRAWFAPNQFDPRVHWLSYDPHQRKAASRDTPIYWGLRTGGWLEVLILAQAILLGVLAGALIPGGEWWHREAYVVIGFLVGWPALVWWTRRLLRKRAGGSDKDAAAARR